MPPFTTGAIFRDNFDNNQKNHLIIGLGGTGGRILRSFRKAQFLERNYDTSNIGFLFVDTDDSLMSGGDSWRIMGQSVDLPEGSKLQLESCDLREILNDIDRFPHIKNWIKKNKSVERFAENTVALDVAGAQRRLFGRISFANKANIFKEKIWSLVSNIRDRTNRNLIDFHICCGISGGTGSGILIDVIAQIRKMYNTQTANIFLYLHIAEEASDWDTGFYFANSYATLKELNGMSILKYHPYDVTSEKGERFNNVTNYFKGAYIVENVNVDGNLLNSKDGIPDLIGNFVFSKIVGNTNRDFLTNVLRRQENFENYEPEPEYDSGETEVDFFGVEENYSRSVRFLGFGIKKLEIPKKEITDSIVLKNTISTINAILFNIWDDKNGFIEAEEGRLTGKSPDQIVDDNKTNWKISNNHFKLESRIIEGENLYKSINEFWSSAISNCEFAVKNSADPQWLSEMIRLGNAQFDRQFRNYGVRDYYDIKSRNINDYVNEIVFTIKGELFRMLSRRDDGISLLKIQRICVAIRDNIERRRIELNESKIRLDQSKKESSKEIGRYLKKWNKIGLLSEYFLNKKERTLGEFSEVLKGKFIIETEAIAIDFANELMLAVQERIINFQNTVSNLINLFNAKRQDLINKVITLIPEENIIYNDPEILAQRNIRFYDPSEIRELTDSLIKNREFQNQTYDLFFDYLKDNIGNNNTDSFTRLINSNSEEIFLKLIDRIYNLYENFMNENEGAVSHYNGIIDDLREKFVHKEEELKSFLKNVIDRSGIYLRFNDLQLGAVVGRNRSANPDDSISVILPNNQNGPFIGKLKEIISAIKPNCIFIEKDDQFKIEIISIVNQFPIRLISHMRTLRDYYLSLSERDKVFVHTDDTCFDLPDLLIKTTQELKEYIKIFQSSDEVYKILLLGYIFNIVREDLDEGRFYFWSINASDIEERKESLGKNYGDNNQHINLPLFNSIKNEVEIEFEKATNSSLGRERLKKQIKSIIIKMKEIKYLDKNLVSKYTSIANSIIKEIKG